MRNKKDRLVTGMRVKVDIYRGRINAVEPDVRQYVDERGSPVRKDPSKVVGVTLDNGEDLLCPVSKVVPCR